MSQRGIRPENHADMQVNRRRALAGIGVLGLIATTRNSVLASQAAATPGATPAPRMVEQEVTMPDWRFGLVEVADPYNGDVTKPDLIPSGVRVVGCQVVITNGSDQPLEFSVRNIRIRDADGVEYAAGEYLGTEPRIVSQNLPDGERTRGWVWAAIPEGTDISSVVFIPPSPVMRIIIK